MPDQQRINYPLMTDAEHVSEMRRLIEEAREVLKQPAPDTFLGRKTAEPFSEEEAAFQINADWNP